MIHTMIVATKISRMRSNYKYFEMLIDINLNII